MPNQYQNFSNPTIIPDKPMGWEAANQSTGDAIAKVSNYALSQQQRIQDLQFQQAQDLSKFKTLDQLYYGGAHNDALDSMLSSNPYGRHLVTPKRNLASSGQPMGGNPNVGGGMIGAPGTSMFGTGVMPMPQAGQGGGSPAPGSGGSMNPVNGPVATGGNVTSGGFEPPKISQSFVNPAGEAQVQAAKTGAEKVTGAQAEAGISKARDTQQLGMITNALKPLVESYDKVYNSKVAGILPGAGDVYGSTVVKNADWLPRSIQSGVVNPETQSAAGQFLANKNELVTKLQPLLSQQFGKDGSVRIMESLLNMSQNELGDLNTPRAQFHGQLTGTISSLYRIAKAAQAYKQDLDTAGQQPPDPKTAATEIFKRMQLQQQSPEEQKELQSLINETLGTKETGGASGSFGGSMNPVAGAKSEAKQEGSVHLTAQIAQKLLQAAGGDKNKARELARNQGYLF